MREIYINKSYVVGGRELRAVGRGGPSARFRDPGEINAEIKTLLDSAEEREPDHDDIIGAALVFGDAAGKLLESLAKKLHVFYAAVSVPNPDINATSLLAGTILKELEDGIRNLAAANAAPSEKP